MLKQLGVTAILLTDSTTIKLKSITFHFEMFYSLN